MPIEIEVVPPPLHGVCRLGRRSSGVFSPPPWELADPIDGTFNNRFDDPGQDDQDVSSRFRVIYCAGSRTGALMETVARFRQSVSSIAESARLVEDASGSGVVYGRVAGISDPGDASRGVVPVEWRVQRTVGHLHLDPSLRFADLGATRTLNHLRRALTDTVLQLGLNDIDLSVVTGPQRTLTQRIARYVHEQVDDAGQPRFAGIRYLSRYGDNQDCWAIFDDRMAYTVSHVELSIPPDDDDLLTVATAFNLSIEMLDGQYLRP